MLNICAVLVFSLAIVKPLYSAEPGCDFDKGSCGLADVIQRAKGVVMVPNIPGPVVATEYNAGLNLNEITQNLRRLEPYMQTLSENGIRRQTFDVKAALEKGFSEDAVLLAQEIISFQNGILKVIVSDEKNVMAVPLDAVKYPRLAAYFNMKPQQQVVRNMNKEPIEPCGDTEHPVPYWSPKPDYYTSNNSEQALFDKGFHHTAGYACGEYTNSDPFCNVFDFTLESDNNGPYGYCEWPRFRYHGVISRTDRTQYSIHGTEPNPEVNSYSWPYWNWPVYVYWWHRTH